jgi:O-antigen ligase
MAYSGYQEPRGSTERRASPAQIVENLKSIFVSSGAQTESTKVWREQWWAVIMEKTLHGPYFWSGRGYGPNLAEEDGFGNRHSERPLRSPHNSHLTLLARGGVPGLTLWASFLAIWFGTIGFAAWRARRSGSLAASNLLVFAASYVLACAVNAAFDVALEAPMQGIWFWCVIGFGSGTAMVYRYLDDARLWKSGFAARIVPRFATDRTIRPLPGT